MSTIDSTSTEKRDVYRKVTDAIINAIEQGVGNWRMPWHTSGRFAFSPINVASKKPYRGINTVCLWAAAQAKGYERGEWATCIRGERAVDHEPDGASIGSDGSAVYSGWKFVPGEQRREAGALTESRAIHFAHPAFSQLGSDAVMRGRLRDHFAGILRLSSSKKFSSMVT